MSFSKTIYAFLAIIYVPFLITVTFFFPVRERSSVNRQYHLIPFQNIIAQIHNPAQYNTPGYWTVFALSLTGNILLFIPAGFLFRFFLPGRNLTIMLYGLSLSVGIELMQLITGVGVCDIDDVILNAAGLYMGILCCMTLHPATKRAAGPLRF